MVQLCFMIAACGIALSALLYIATKLHWRIAAPLWKFVPRLTTLAAVLLLFMFVMISIGGTNDLTHSFGKGLKEVEYTLRNWFSSLKPRGG